MSFYQKKTPLMSLCFPKIRLLGMPNPYFWRAAWRILKTIKALLMIQTKQMLPCTTVQIDSLGLW